MKNSFGYIRVSTLRQGDGVSLVAQRKAIEDYASRHQLTITRWYEEKVTAAKSGRPAFNAMIKALLNHDADALIVHKIDRSARNFADWAKIGDVSDAGIEIHFATETLDFRSRGGRLAADIQAVFAADYVRNLKDECLKGMNGRLQQGLWPWAAPFGYLDRGGGKPKAIDPESARVVRRTFSLYATGQHSLRTLQNEMIRQGLRGKRDRPITLHGIERILSNPFYCGLLRSRLSGETYQGVHEPLISVEVYRRVQAIKEGRYGKKVTLHDHTYRGLFRCARCGGGLTGERQKGRVYYRCHQWNCGGASVREDAIEKAVIALLRRTTLAEEDRRTIEKAVLETFDQDRRPSERDTGIALKRIDDRISVLVDAYLDHQVDKEAYAIRREGLLMERRSLQERLEQVPKVDANRQNVVKFFELLQSLAQLYETTKSAEKRQIVFLATSNRLVDGKNVVVEPDTWLSPFQNELGVASGGHHWSENRMQKLHVDAPRQPRRRRLHQYSEQYLQAVLDALRSERVRALLQPAHDVTCMVHDRRDVSVVRIDHHISR